MAPSKKKGSTIDPYSELTSLGEAEKTGVVRIDPPAGLRSDVYLMGGAIIACNTDHDRRHLADLLVAAGSLGGEDMEAALDGLTDGDDLADTLVAGGVVEGAQVMEARSVLFRDNLAWALAWAAAKVDFEALDAVFPANMQFGLDRDEILEDVRGWRDRVAPTLELLGSEDLWTAGAQRPPGCSKEIWAQLGETRTIDELMELLPPPRRDAAEKVALWMQMSALVPADEGEDEGLTDEPATELTEDDHGGDDYAKAAAGGFIKSYEVLDKVDLSGVSVVGAEERGPPSLEAIEALAIDEHDEDHDDDEFLTEADDDLEPDTAPLGDTRPAVQSMAFADEDDLASGDFDIFDDGSEDADLVVDDVSAESLPAISLEDIEGDGDDAGASASIVLADLDTPFTREQLNEFHERISVFNNIFRIVFGTFAEHITPAKALQRFNALLGSGQRQYPELFKDLLVEQDGTIAPSALINNLAACPPGDYGSLLHQGLYELIFSHLYDAKDMLPGDAEMQMMEKIVVFERQLHQM